MEEESPEYRETEREKEVNERKNKNLDDFATIQRKLATDDSYSVKLTFDCHIQSISFDMLKERCISYSINPIFAS
jgi:hypothetical protein